MLLVINHATGPAAVQSEAHFQAGRKLSWIRLLLIEVKETQHQWHVGWLRDCFQQMLSSAIPVLFGAGPDVAAAAGPPAQICLATSQGEESIGPTDTGPDRTLEQLCGREPGFTLPPPGDPHPAPRHFGKTAQQLSNPAVSHISGRQIPTIKRPQRLLLQMTSKGLLDMHHYLGIQAQLKVCTPSQAADLCMSREVSRSGTCSECGGHYNARFVQLPQ